MCGLIGIISKNWNKHLPTTTETVFKQLIYAGALRGFDATGIWKVTDKHETEIVKHAMPAGYFLSQRDSFDLINTYYRDSFAIFAHNRKATQGAKDDKTAHPFKEGPITLMHNGTLSYWPRQKLELLSDSHYIATLLAEEQKEFKPIESLQGAYALIWHNANKKQINFCRNDERPLFIVEAKEFYLLVSEAEMGEWILLRNGFDVYDTVEVQENFIYKMSWKNNKLNLNKAKFSPSKLKWANSTKQSSIWPDEDPDDYNSMATPGMASINRPPAVITPYTPPANSGGFGTEKKSQGLVYGAEMLVKPKHIKRDVTGPGGQTKWSGFGVKEFRVEITGDILLPLAVVGQTFYISMKADDFDETILNQECLCEYHYRKNDNCITVMNITPKDDGLASQDIEQPSVWITTKNGVPITEDNFDDISQLNCSHCNSPFELDDADECLITEKVSYLDGLETVYGYTYVCPYCVPEEQDKQKNTNQKTATILSLPEKVVNPNLHGHQHAN